MAKTIANLRVGVRMYLDESQQTDFLDTEVDREINYAYHDVVANVMEVWEEYFSTTTPKYISSVASQQEYSLDTSLIKVTRVEINYEPSVSGSQAIRAIPLRLDELPLNLGNSSIGGGGLFNAGYYIHGQIGSQKIGFVPIPSNAGTNNISTWGIEMPSDLSDNNTSVTIPYADRFGKLIEIKAASELLRKGQQEEDAANDLLKIYLVGLSDMKQFLKERQGEGVVMIEDAIVEDIQFDSPL